MGCGASAPAPNQVADEGPTLKSPEQKPAAAEKPAAEAPPPQAASKPAPAAPSSSESKGAPPASKANGRGPQAPIAHSKALPDRIRTEELIKLCQSSHFDRTQVEKLYELFKVISSSGDDDGLIDKSEFQQALGLKRNLFVDRMFELFDANGDKNINFTEFVAGLSVFTFRAKAAEKARFSFRMYDFNGDGKIDKAELGRMLQATIEENSLNITPEAAQELLDATFVEAECAEAGTMTFDEYQALVTKKPQLLEFMTITSLNQVIS